MSDETPDEKNPLMAIGRLGSPFGIQGFLRVHSYSGETEHFRVLSDVVLAREDARTDARIAEVQVASRDLYIRMEGSSGPEDARRWTGWEILVPRRQAAPCGPGEYYIADLAGCALVLRKEAVGSVLSVLEGGAAPLLEIRLFSGKTVLVPFRKEFIGNVDVQARELELLVDWILE